MDLHYLELLDVAELIRGRQISPVELTKSMLARIEAIDPTLKSYVHVTADIALDQAQAAESEIARGHYRGPLHGVPVAVKDLFSRRGVPTAAGMPLRKEFRPDQDATAIRRLNEAGAVLLGNLVMTEGAHGDHRPPLFAAPLNPWNHDLWSGASSSGSGVAAAAGLCFAALGTETGGSIRLPSAADGVTGLKPTWGRVSRAGVFELSATLDHVGPLARSARDAGAVLAAIAGPDRDDPTASREAVPDYCADLDGDLRGVRIGLDEGLVFTGMSPEVEVLFRDALDVFKGRGARIVPVELPDIKPMVAGYLPLSGVQTAVAHARSFAERPEAYGPSLTTLIELGQSLSATAYHELILMRMEFRGRIHALLEEVDMLVLPVLSNPVPTVAAMLDMSDDVIESIVRFTSPFAMSGHPAIAMPCGFTSNRGPVAIQLVGRSFDEARLVRSADAFQRETSWHKRRAM